MASMTDVISLLLIFFMVASTLAVSNATKVSLPFPQSTATTQESMARITIDAEGYCYISAESASETTLLPVEGLEAKLYEVGAAYNEEEDPYVVLYADKSVSYGGIVKVLNVPVTTGLRMISATGASQGNNAEIDA